MSHSESNKRILKNTLALYFRQIIIMVVSLFTSRVILQTLGVTDYGINHVVGGVVSMLSFLTSSLSDTTQRFINVELGKNDHIELKRVFSNSLSLYLIFISLVIILAETAGLWFFKNKLVIPPERMDAAFWVYQFSIISFAVSVFFTPFNGAIKAHEKFSFYAQLSVFDVVAKLAVTFLIYFLPFDKLFVISFLHMCVIFAGRLITYIYCRKHFEECRIRFSWAKDCVQRLMGYNVYKIIDALSYMLRFQALNVVLNMYYGPVLNAAQGVANTVNHALASFANNASAATQPQVITSYAQNDRERLWDLITKSSRLYFYLLLILTLPFILEIESALSIWLGEYPEYAPAFTRLFLLEALQRILSYPIGQVNSAVGKLRSMTINSIVCRVLILLSAIILGLNKVSPVYIYISALVFQEINFCIAVIIAIKIQAGFSLRAYFTSVVIPITKTTLPVAILPVVLHFLFSRSVFSVILIGSFTVIWSGIIIFCIGLKKSEKQMILKKLPQPLQKLFSKQKGCV